METQHHAGVVLFGVHHFLVICVAQEGQDHPVRAQGRLDDIGDIMLAGFLIEVFQLDAGVLAVLTEVVVGAIRDAPQLAPAEGEEKLEIGGGFGVVGKLLLLVIPQLQVFLLHAHVQQPVPAVVLPEGKPFQVGAGLAEEFQFHLLEFPGAEGEVAGGDFVAKALADLGHAEGDFFAGGALDVGEVDKDALSGLGPEIQLIFRVLGDALEGFEHQVKGADVGEVVFAAFRAADIVLVDIRLHFLEAPAGGQSARVLDKLIGTVAGFAAFAVHEGVGEVAYVAGGDPHLGIHQDGGIQAHIVGAFLDELLPPGALDVIF